MSAGNPFASLSRGTGPKTDEGPRPREIKEWVRVASGASEEATITVTELACTEPGCPPYEVVMAVFEPGQPPRQKKLHRRRSELVEDVVRDLWSGEHSDDHHDHAE